MQEVYKLVGYLNLFEIIPVFVYPVFEKDNQYYLQYGNEETLKSVEFAPVKKECIDRIVFLKDIDTNVTEVEISLESKPIFGFQLSESNVYIGNFEEVKEFLQTFKTDDSILQEEIKNFLNISKEI